MPSWKYLWTSGSDNLPRQTFHTEETGDVIGWLTRSAAATGGKCIIASGHTVYNVLAAARPDLVRILARSDWPFAL